MTDFGYFMYDLNTGKTIGVRGGLRDEEAEKLGVKNAKYEKDTYRDCSYNEHEKIRYEENFCVLEGIEHLSNYENRGTVTDLTFEQVVSLFSSGNLVVDELQTWLNENKCTFIDIQEVGNQTKVSFIYNKTTYNLSVATDAAKSQIDNIKDTSDVQSRQEITQSSQIRIFENKLNSGATFGASGFDDNNIFGVYNDISSSYQGPLKYMKNNQLVQWVFNNAIGHLESYFQEAIGDTQDIEFFQDEYPEITHGWNCGFASSNLACDAVTFQKMWQYALANGMVNSVDDVYCEDVAKFISGMESGIEDKNNPWYAFEYNSNSHTVTLSDKTVEMFDKYLQSSKAGTKYYSTFGLSTSDAGNLDTIREKLETFMKSAGATTDSNGNLELHIEDFYNSLSPIYMSYDERVKDYNDSLRNLNREAQKEQSQYNKKYASGEAFDVFGNGKKSGPEGSCATGIDGVYIKFTYDTVNGFQGYDLYLYDPKTSSFKKTHHKFDDSFEREWNLVHYKQPAPEYEGFNQEEIAYIRASVGGYNMTSVDGVYEKDGKYYTFVNNAFAETTAVSNDIQIYTSRSGSPYSYVNNDNNYISIIEDDVEIINPATYEPAYDISASNGIPSGDYTQYPAPEGQYPEENYNPYSHELETASKGNTPQQYKNQDMKNIVDSRLNYINSFGKKDEGYLLWYCDFDVNEDNIGETVVTYGKDFEEAVKKWLTNAVKDLEDNGFKYEPNNAFKNRQLFNMLFNKTEYVRPITQEGLDNYIKELHEYLDNPEKFSGLIQNFKNAMGLDSNGQGKLEDVFDVLSGKSDEYYENKAKGNTFIQNLKEQYPEVYKEWGSAMNGFTPRMRGSFSDGETRIDEYMGNVLYENTITCYFQEVLELAAGIEQGDSNSVRQEKLRSVFERVGITEKSGVEFVNSVELMQYLLGSNDGINWFETLANKKEAKLDAERELNEYMANYDSEHTQVSVKNISIPESKIPEGAMQTKTEGVYLTMDDNNSTFRLHMWNSQKEEFEVFVINSMYNSTPVLKKDGGKYSFKGNYNDYYNTKEELLSALVEKFDVSLEGKSILDIEKMFSGDNGYIGSPSDDTLRTFYLYSFGMNPTSEEGVYEKNGKFYVFADKYGESYTKGRARGEGSWAYECDNSYLYETKKQYGFNDIFKEVTRNLASEYEVDTTIKVDEARTNEEVFKDTPDVSLVAEITSYIMDLVAPVYREYWQIDERGALTYKYFNGSGLAASCDNPDSAHYRRQGYTWKNESDRQACLAEFNAIAQKVMEKYGDQIDSLVFDGEKFIFTTGNDHYSAVGEYINGSLADGQTECYYSSWYNGVNIRGSENGRFTAYPNCEDKETNSWFVPGGMFEGCTDNFIIYSPITVYSGDIPDEMPADPNGGTFIATAIPGVIVSTAQQNGGGYLNQKTYVWDERNQQYVKCYVDVLDAMNGYANFASGGDPEVTAIAIARLYGYQQTSDPYVFKRGDKFYVIDMDTLNKFRGICALKEADLFSEVQLTEVNHSSKKKASGKTGNTTGGQGQTETKTTGETETGNKTEGEVQTGKTESKTGDPAKTERKEYADAKADLYKSVLSMFKGAGEYFEELVADLNNKYANGEISKTDFDKKIKTIFTGVKVEAMAEKAEVTAKENAEKSERETYAETLKNKYIEELKSYEGADNKFAQNVSELVSQYTNGQIKKDDFDAKVKAKYEEIKADFEKAQAEAEKNAKITYANTLIASYVENLKNDPEFAEQFKSQVNDSVEAYKSGLVDKDELNTLVRSFYEGILTELELAKGEVEENEEVSDTPAKTSGAKTDADIVLPNFAYEQEANDNLGKLQNLGLRVVKQNPDGSYEAYYNNILYNCVWDPVQKKWILQKADAVTGAETSSVNNDSVIRAKKILSAIIQGLHFTGDLDVCKDDDGNKYVFDEKQAKYVKQD